MKRGVLVLAAVAATAWLAWSSLAAFDASRADRAALAAGLATALAVAVVARIRLLVTLTVVVVASLPAAVLVVGAPSPGQIVVWAVALGIAVEAALHATLYEPLQVDDLPTILRQLTPWFAAVAAPPVAALGLALLYRPGRPSSGWAVALLGVLLLVGAAVLSSLSRE